MNSRFHEFFLLRRPALSLSSLLAFNKSIDANPEQYTDIMMDRFLTREFQEALFLASADLYYSFEKIMQGDYQGDAKPIYRALYRYFVRMSSRPTPFGTMAGVCTGEISAEPTKISFPESAKMVTKTQLSFTALARLSRAIASMPNILPHLTLCSNTSLYRFQNIYRYIRRSGRDNDRFNQLEVESNSYLDLVLAQSKTPVPFGDLTAALINAGLDHSNAQQLITTLFEQQLLYSEIDAGPIQQNGLDRLLRSLEKIPSAASIIKDLHKIKYIISRRTGINVICERLHPVILKYCPDIRADQILFVNSTLQAESCKINQKPVAIIQNELDELVPLSSPTVNNELDNFTGELFRRYQTRPVLLLEALDPDTGIGYGNRSFSGDSSVTDVTDASTGPNDQFYYNNSQLEDLRLTLYEQSISQQTQKVHIRKKHLPKASKQSHRANDGTYLMGKFIADSQKNLDNGKFKFSLSAMGSASSFNLMARFCSDDNELTGLVSQAISCEELVDAEVIYAEINHIPSDKEGNILSRPHLRKYEITYLSVSKTAKENQVTPDDLYLYTPDGKQLVLWSKSHDKRVIPRLTSAHNFANGLPVYRLLCDLARQNAAPVFNWHWGHFSGKDFLPRIEYKHIIVSVAQWRVSMEMLPEAHRKNTSVQQLRELLKKRRIPRLIQIADGDQLLLVDCDSTVSLDMLLSMLRRRRKLRLTEFIEPAVQSFMVAGGESYSHEVIVPFKGNTSLSWPKVTAPKVSNSTRQYATGSEWIYVKVYMAPSLADQILTENFLPFLTHLLGQAAIKKWFFVRYNDPGYHLRIRIFAGDDKNRVFEILRLFCDQLHVLLKASKIEKFVIDTYERELERYALIEYHLTETLFYYDSLSVCQLLSLSNKGAIPKWQIAIRSIDFILNSLGYNLQQKRAFVQAVHGSFYVEFQSQQPLIYQMDKSYRSHISQVQFTLSNNPENLLKHQIDECLQPSLDHYRHISSRLQDAPGAETYISSVVHMFLNRLFSDSHRKLEFLVYHYLKKYYDSIYFKLKTVTIL
ncbi:hypothetical protein DSL64_16045 [Dyadobacter luteus]|uniref:Lantibiotic dehydratase n=1 Tax=Dyadobacter luteus TaxID=2259619 RepID=A0A3D8Y9P3_9BACT|nr:lantibiotic dehydratase [Dyadobacter luteus]REA60183.1 hypothetical protein DSL64_16045 [Dyadobacter luteus]